jgi:hypothetical protein
MSPSTAMSSQRWFYLLLILPAMLVVGFGLALPHVRVGDGSEYYAMYYAWRDHFRPYMDPGSAMSYGKAVEAGQIIGLVHFDRFREAFPYLVLGPTQDFNHFWLYSALAAVLGAVPGVAATPSDPTSAFVALHAVLITAAVFVAWRFFRLAGAVSVVLLCLGSPLLWFVNKAHTEFFTVCVCLIAVVFAMAGRMAWATFALALASTQNPSFAIPAVVGGLIWLYQLKVKPRPMPYQDGIAIVLASVVAILHPLYYFSRYGKLSPQVFGSGTDFRAGNLLESYIWLLDPDVGLIPYFPIAIALLVGGAMALQRRKLVLEPAGKLLLLVLLAINLVAHSVTSNVNSGGSYQVSRYALWYLPLLFPFAVASLRWIFPVDQAPARKRLAAVTALAIVWLVLNTQAFFPGKPENYLEPSKVSLAVQRYLPWLYSPKLEILLERNAGTEGFPASTPIAAIVTANCRDVIVNSKVSSGPVLSKYCRNTVFDESLLNAKVRSLPAVDEWYGWRRVRLAKEDIKAIGTRFDTSTVLTAENGFRGVLRHGWSGIEPWGVWSDGGEAAIMLPIYAEQFPRGVKLALNVNAFVPPALKQQEVKAMVNGKPLASWRFDPASGVREETIELEADALSEAPLRLMLRISSPTSPRSLAGSGDPRELGVGLRGIRLLAR